MTDAGVKAAGLVDKVLAALPGLKPALFDATPSNPTAAAVRAAVQVYQPEQCDGLIALGWPARDARAAAEAVTDEAQAVLAEGGHPSVPALLRSALRHLDRA